MPFVHFHHVAREWRCKWSSDSDNESLMEAQSKLNEALDALSSREDVLSVQRIVCGTCNDFKVIVKMNEKAFKEWEAAGFAPEASFLEALKSVPGISEVQTQTYTLEDVKLSRRECRKLHEYKEKEEKEHEREATDPAYKQLKAVMKEGGKRGVEIEGAADLGGLHFFCTAVTEPDGDLELLEESVKAMNAKSDIHDLERKGGSDHIGKMVFSAGAAQLAVVAYVPEHKREEVACEEWIEKVIGKYSGGEVFKREKDICTGRIPADPKKNIFPLKIKEALIKEANDFLRARGLFPQDTGEEGEEVVYGDDDFPGA